MTDTGDKERFIHVDTEPVSFMPAVYALSLDMCDEHHAINRQNPPQYTSAEHAQSASSTRMQSGREKTEPEAHQLRRKTLHRTDYWPVHSSGRSSTCPGWHTKLIPLPTTGPSFIHDRRLFQGRWRHSSLLAAIYRWIWLMKYPLL